MPLPSHMHVSDIDGALYDTRVPHWYDQAPLRSNYRCGKGYLTTLIEYPYQLLRHVYVDFLAHIFEGYRIVAIVDKDMAVVVDLAGPNR